MKKLSNTNIQKSKQKIQMYLSHRDYSIYELKNKLIKFFSKEEVNQTLNWAKINKLLPSEKELSLRLSQILNQKKAGYLKIKADLYKKRLPLVDKDLDLEEQKCLWWILKIKPQNTSFKLTTKLYRTLSYKGFELPIIKKALNKYYKHYLYNKNFHGKS